MDGWKQMALRFSPGVALRLSRLIGNERYVRAWGYHVLSELPVRQ